MLVAPFHSPNPLNAVLQQRINCLARGHLPRLVQLQQAVVQWEICFLGQLPALCPSESVPPEPEQLLVMRLQLRGTHGAPTATLIVPQVLVTESPGQGGWRVLPHTHLQPAAKSFRCSPPVTWACSTGFWNRWSGCCMKNWSRGLSKATSMDREGCSLRPARPACWRRDATDPIGGGWSLLGLIKSRT